MRSSRSVLAGAVLATGLSVVAAACGGGGTASPAAAAEPESTAFASESADFQLTRESDLGTHDAYVTFTSRSDGKTDAIVDFYVPRTGASRDDKYSVTIQAGACSSLGETTISLGDLPAGVTVVELEEAFDDAVGPLEDGSSSLVIKEPGAKTVAWCGPA
jgi:hypothetical protein